MATLLSLSQRIQWSASTGLLTGLLQRFATARSRRALGRLDDRLLRDIDLSRAQAESEASRGFWDAPPHWRL